MDVCSLEVTVCRPSQPAQGSRNHQLAEIPSSYFSSHTQTRPALKLSQNDHANVVKIRTDTGFILSFYYADTASEKGF